MYVFTFFFIQDEGGKGRAVLKSIRKVISYLQGYSWCAGVWEHSAGFDTCRTVWGTSRWVW